jgi:hypothetical protein
MPRQHPSLEMNKTEMIQKNILSLFHFMTFCPISTLTVTTAELVCNDKMGMTSRRCQGCVKEYDAKKVDQARSII